MGSYTTNQFLYKPALGATGTTEKSSYDAGLDLVDARLGKVIYVTDPLYGALGNGVADDTNAIQKAFDYGLSTGRTVIIPPGAYKITSTLYVNPGLGIQVRGYGNSPDFTNRYALNIIGFGPGYGAAPYDNLKDGISTLLYTGGAGSVIQIDGGSNLDNALRQSRWSDFMIYCTGTPTIGVEFISNPCKCVFDNVNISMNSAVTDSVCLKLWGNGNGLTAWYDTARPYANRWRDCKFYGAALYGVQLGSGSNGAGDSGISNNVFIGCNNSCAAKTPWFIVGGQNSIIGCYTQGAPTGYYNSVVVYGNVNWISCQFDNSRPHLMFNDMSYAASAFIPGIAYDPTAPYDITKTYQLDYTLAGFAACYNATTGEFDKATADASYSSSNVRINTSTPIITVNQISKALEVWADNGLRVWSGLRDGDELQAYYQALAHPLLESGGVDGTTYLQSSAIVGARRGGSTNPNGCAAIAFSHPLVSNDNVGGSNRHGLAPGGSVSIIMTSAITTSEFRVVKNDTGGTADGTCLLAVPTTPTAGATNEIKFGYGSTAPKILFGTIDPTTASGVVAQIGSLYSNTTTGALYSKTGSGNTNWTVR